ncbi:MAG TPA: MBOAT family O-acyltransferase [Ferruginibacter sp.]|nr:MBOAT family O-acyltransferase [Ferruginibacter sp.]HMP21504.1 MBOAT family O-acyltransferase [Ferruginibacter sp.]
MPALDIAELGRQLLYDPKNPLLFNHGFFVFFFTIFMVLYYYFRNNFAVRRYIFCFFSLYFFYKASGFFVVFVIIAAIVDYLVSNAIFRAKSKQGKLLLLIVSIFFNLGLLFYFKYTNFFIACSNEFLGTNFNLLNILLPVGISFYTFENLSYTIDIYRGQFEPARKFSDYLLFLSFFPKLVMGPIVRAHDFVPQINKPYIVSDKDFAKGFYLILSGLFKKLVLSDYLTLNYVDYIFDDPARYTGLENLFAIYGYAAVIYCDFSGYSDVALGIARWLGFSIPVNFLSPYQSKSITEFWRRWHISLSSWLKDYLYIPLGGNRKGTVTTWIFTLAFFAGVFMACLKLFNLSVTVIISLLLLLLFLLPAFISKQVKAISAGFNLLTTMLLGGFWHGASWSFIIWGILHGIALAVHKSWMLLTGKALAGISNSRWYNAITIIITFHFVCLCWVFFKAADVAAAITMIKQVLYDFTPDAWPGFFANYRSVLAILLLAALLHAIPDSFADRVIDKFHRAPLLAYISLFFLFVLLYGFFKSSEQVLPIYLKF